MVKQKDLIEIFLKNVKKFVFVNKECSDSLDPSVKFISCKDEKDLLIKFHKCILDENPDIINNDQDNTIISRYGNPSNFFFPKASLGTKIVSKGYNRLSLLQKQGQMP